ncbi:MAG: glycine cleavage system aminomethyltransferase GcvT [Elusimicrobia bacterium]|nr:glycine cleavage system aminomethyltransferase GcvT [Elusimicrobiota bacterium]
MNESLSVTPALRRTPFHFRHQQNGARLVPFAGWEMPVQFESVMAEHRAVRERAGIFDISHMGQLWVTGPGAQESLQKLLTNDIGGLPAQRGLYALLCNEEGMVVDDLYVYCLDPQRYLLIVNASRVSVDEEWIRPRLGLDTKMTEQPQPAALAVQGPAASEVMAKISKEACGLKKNGVAEIPLMDMEVVVARTGYTGEDGFELFGPAGHLFPVYEFLMKEGKPLGLVNCGLGARDTLRLEMGYRLYGHELDDTHSPLEAGLGWAVKLEKPFFVGRGALVKEKEGGSRRRLMGFQLQERGVPREKCEICFAGDPVGYVTSGTFSPTLGAGIGMGYVDIGLLPPTAETNPEWTIRIHGRAVPADRAALPFYRKSVLPITN